MAQLADAHVQALLSLVRAVVPCYDGKVPDEPSIPYTVIYPSQGDLGWASLEGDSTTLDLSFQITAVGLTRAQAGWAADKARVALLDKKPTVTGRACGQILQESSVPIQRDDDVVPPVFYAINQYRLMSVPST